MKKLNKADILRNILFNMKKTTKKRKDLFDKYQELIECLTIAEQLSEELCSEKIYEKIKLALRQTIDEMDFLTDIIYAKKSDKKSEKRSR